jgi:hypothetical protein
MPKIVNEQICKATKQHILREAARESAYLGFDQANVNMIAKQAGEIIRLILNEIGIDHSQSCASLFC